MSGLSRSLIALVFAAAFAGPARANARSTGGEPAAIAPTNGPRPIAADARPIAAGARPIAADAGADSTDDDIEAEGANAEPAEGVGELGPSTAPPWNPPKALSASEPWETVLRTPGRIVSLPFSLLGRATKNTLIFVEESAVVPRVLGLIALQRRVGVYLGTASLGDRTGLGGRILFAPPPLDGRVFGELSASTGQYNRARTGVGWGPARATYEYEWRSRDQFFGLGRDSREEDVSTYASRIQRATLSLGWAWGREDGPVHRASAWVGPREMVQRDGRDPKKPGVVERFPSLAAGILDTHVEHLVYGVHLSEDRRGGRPHWSRGWRLAADLERYDEAIEALAIRDAGTPEVQFTRMTFEGEGGVSFHRDPRTLRLAVRAVNHQASGSGVFLLYDLAHLGGREGLAGFEPGRFHGSDMIVGKLSYIFPLAKHLEFDVHAEAGNVYDRLEDARFDTLEHSYGVALRPRLETAPLGQIGVDWSDETVRVRFSFGGVE
jgi:hypothetical protein